MARPATRPGLTPRFPSFGAGGGYESYYVRAVDPDRPRSVWLRHTVHQAPGEAPIGSAWVTVFGAPELLAHKASESDPAAGGGRLRIGDSAFGPDGVEGAAGPAEWDLRWTGDEPPLRHLPKEFLYSAPLPKTKLESPRPAVRVHGRVTVGATTVELDGWPGMVGHNWGAQHAERWIWLHGTAFEGGPDDWLDLALGRVRIGRATTPWVANGVISLGGERLRVGGTARPRVNAGPLHLDLSVGGRAARVRLTVHSRREQTVVWRYADPDGSQHHVANCSVAELEAVVHPRGSVPMTLRTAHGGTYELGMREAPEGLAIQRFPDP
ncbi:MAG TPA: hypothetical protein VK501_24405 [Baekduia sp.]|uniref:hypothetical protein n=1 Tax=Baekduia sp. TaxID=2600305 RepID=UPI002BD5EF4A|nr:hypothetical protein [Baekduia sp.]HMJ37069.1 hypothetical protein [Baekduia sp.]